MQPSGGPRERSAGPTFTGWQALSHVGEKLQKGLSLHPSIDSPGATGSELLLLDEKSASPAWQRRWPEVVESTQVRRGSVGSSYSTDAVEA